MNGMKWTTTAGLFGAIGIMAFTLWGAMAAAEEAGGYFMVNEAGFFWGLVTWWVLIKMVLDAGVWLRGKMR